jgi:hypothetical protein
MESIDDQFVRACMHGDTASVELLLRSGASVDSELSTWNYDTPLILAAQAGHVAVCASLLAAKADPNIRTQTSHTTALVEAVRFSHIDVVDVILSHGANPSVVDSVCFLSLSRHSHTHMHTLVSVHTVHMIIVMVSQLPFDGEFLIGVCACVHCWLVCALEWEPIGTTGTR